MTEHQMREVMKTAINAMTDAFLTQEWKQMQLDALHGLQWALAQPLEIEKPSLWKKRNMKKESEHDQS